MTKDEWECQYKMAVLDLLKFIAVTSTVIALLLVSIQITLWM